MAIPAIHPGEHLAEELKTLDMSAAALARQIQVPTNRITGILKGQRGITGDTGPSFGPLFRLQPGVLAESAKAPRTAAGRGKSRQSHPGAADSRHRRTRAGMKWIKASGLPFSELPGCHQCLFHD